LYHPSIPQNKCSTICVGLSLVFIKKRGTGYREKIWTHGGPRKKRKKDSHALKRIYRERSYKRKEFPFHPP